MKSELNMAYPDSNVLVDIAVGTRSGKLYILSSDSKYLLQYSN